MSRQPCCMVITESLDFSRPSFVLYLHTSDNVMILTSVFVYIVCNGPSNRMVQPSQPHNIYIQITITRHTSAKQIKQTFYKCRHRDTNPGLLITKWALSVKAKRGHSRWVFDTGFSICLFVFFSLSIHQVCGCLLWNIIFISVCDLHPHFNTCLTLDSPVNFQHVSL